MIRALVESLTVTDVRSRLAEVAVPALVMHRRSDFVPFAEAELMARGIRGARLVELEFFGIFPVGGGLALAFVQGPRGEYPTFRRDPLTAYVSELRSRPALAGLLGEAVIAERLRGTAALPTFFRISSGPGWALVGDAGHHKDPVIARGIADAFRDADLVASAVVDGWHGDLEGALAEYGRQRDRCAIPLSDANLGVARLDMATGALGAAWFQMNGLEQALDDPAARPQR